MSLATVPSASRMRRCHEGGTAPMGRLFLALRHRPDRGTTGQGVRAAAQWAGAFGSGLVIPRRPCITFFQQISDF